VTSSDALRRRSARLSLALFAAACAAFFGAATALEPTAIIAESSRAKLSIADYEAEVRKLPDSARAEFAANQLRLRQYLDNLYMLRVLAADARAEGLDKDPVLARQIAIQIDRMLAQAMVDRIEAAAESQFEKDLDKHVARVREIYAVSRDKHAVPERVRAAHVLVKISDGDREAAMRKAEQVRAQAVAGADFAALARQFSDDPAAAKNGGDLGFFEAKAMDPAFAAAAFALKNPGDLSEPVLSKFGYHVILFKERRPASVRTFDEVRPELLAQQKKKAIDDARAAAQREIFSDPTLKVDAALIERINADAAAAVAAQRKVPSKDVSAKP
jgi:peptidyl-prolyl cis-trans isomerase C